MKRAADKADEEAGARRQPLTRERIIETALRIMDMEELEAVTMRRIGRELGVEAMSLYNHVRDKEDILDGVTEMVMGKFEIPERSGEWVEDMKALAREWRRLLRMHPSVMRLMAERHKPLETLDSYRPMEAALEVISGGGLSPREVVKAFDAFGSYIFGFVVMEQGLMIGQSLDHKVKHRELADALEGADLPHLRAALPHFLDCSTDEQFEYGLDLLIAGLRARGAGTG